MTELRGPLGRIPDERLPELVNAAAYGTVLVMAALAVISVSDVARGHGVELVAGVGGATWVAHLFAELLAGHLHRAEPLHRHVIVEAMVDGSPILLAAVLPAVALLLGRLDVVSDGTALWIAIAVAIVQLMAIGGLVGRVSPGPGRAWAFAIGTGTIGLVVVAIKLTLSH
jgi:hypothetical protein